jgi:hypothetical protein
MRSHLFQQQVVDLFYKPTATDVAVCVIRRIQMLRNLFLAVMLLSCLAINSFANTIETAKDLTIGSPFTDALTTGEKAIYYKFTLSEAGYVAVNLKHASNGNGNSFWKVKVQSSDTLKEYLFMNNTGINTDHTKYVGLPAGTYLVQVTQGDYYDDRNYTLTVSSTPGNYEIEKNDSIADSQTIVLGTSYTGNLETYSSGIDYYKFSLSEAGYVAVNLKHVSNGNGNSFWKVKVQSSDTLKEYLFMNNTGNNTDHTKYVGLPAGTYLVQVTQGDYYDDRNYTLTVSSTPGNYEIEKNDSIADSQTIVLGTSYTGNLETYSIGTDIDYYKFTLSEAGYVTVNFKHASNGNGNSFWKERVLSSDGLTEYLFLDTPGSAVDQTKSVGLPAGTYLVKVSQGDYGSDIDYKLTVALVPDTTAPTISNSTPANGTTNVPLSTPVTITFSEAIDPATISTAKLLKLGNISVPGTGTFNTGTTVYTFTPSVPLSFNTTYSYTVAGVKDVSGNILTAPYSASFTTIAKPVNVIIPTISLALSSSSTLISNSSAVTLSGVMGAGANKLTDQPITITITTPETSVVTIPLTSDSNGAFSVNLRSHLGLAGRYTIQAAAGTVTTSTDTAITTIAPANSSPVVLRVLDQNGKAIIVVGSIASGEGKENHAKTAERVKRALLARGFVEGDITTIASMPGNSGKQALADALAASKIAISAKPASLHLILIDHGDKEKFHLDSEVLTPAELGALLDTFETGLPLQALDQSRYITIGACYSGSFIPLIAKNGRTVITSAKDNEQSFRGPLEPDEIRSGEYFIDEFYGTLKKGASIRDAFNTATATTATYSRRGGIVSSFGDRPLQNPLISIDGAIGATWLPTGYDDNAPETLYLGSGADSAYNPGGMVPKDRTAKIEAIFLTNTATSAVISTGSSADQKAWFEVRAPSNKLAQTGGSNQLDVVLPRIFMTWDTVTGTWSSAYSGFYEFGSYNIITYQQGGDGEIARKNFTLYRNRPGNLTPAAALQLTPANNAEVESTLVPIWNVVTDPDNDMVSYNLIVSISADMANPVLVKEGLTDSYAVIVFEDGLMDLTTYYWQVWSIDSYGATAKSAVRSFKTDNKNGLPGLIKGYIRDADGNPISNATITFGSGRFTKTLANGGYIILTDPGSCSLAITAPGYQAKTVNLYTTPGTVLSNDMLLIPVAQVVRNITTNIAGLGLGFTDCPATIADGASITCRIQPGAGYKLRSISGCGGIQSGNQFAITAVTSDCTVTTAFNSLIQYGDCDHDGQVTISEVQSSINMFLGLKSIEACVDFDNNGMVAISEVQKVINSFLGM